MKKAILVCCIQVLIVPGYFSLTAQAQSAADVFQKSTPLTWLGVDYSDARYIGALEVGASQLDDYAKVINDLILREPKKYNLPSAFDKESVGSNLTYIEKANAAMNTDKALSSDAGDMKRYTLETITDRVKSYKLNESGIGLVFIVEAMSKTHEESPVWVTFVDMKSGAVLFSERVTGKPAGFGFRNYWAGAVYSTLKQIKGGLYNKWKKQYAK